MQLLISDANILIDMEEGQLIELMFQLPYQYSTPDILFIEELEDEHQYLLDLGLSLSELSSNTMEHAMELIPRYIKASRNDCFALALARQEECTLLTGDKALRSAAETEDVEVKGSIWLVRKMIEAELLSADQARVSFERMKDTGRRLPWTLIKVMLNDF